jgi:hypothetical protein
LRRHATQVVQTGKKRRKKALAQALEDLESVRMTWRDDPKLPALKDGIRRSVEQPDEMGPF